MKKETKRISVLIPDGESHLLIYIINCFSLVKGVELYVMSNTKNNPMRFSRHIKTFLSHKNPEYNLQWIQTINTYTETHKIDVILPIFETGIQKIIELKNSLKSPEKLCPLPSLNSFNTAQNKGLLYLHLKNNNIASPESIIIPKGSYPDNLNLNFPLVAKPVKDYGGGMGVAILRHHKDIKHYYTKRSFSSDTIIQNYINGYDICANVLCKEGDLIAYSIQRGNSFTNGELSPQSGFTFVNNKELLHVIKRLLKSLNWSGVANIDCRYDKNDKQFKVIEINTRFWANTDASAVAGVNYPYLNCLLGINQIQYIPVTQLITYLNLKGLVHKLKTKPLFITNFKYILNNTPLKFAILDPLPMIYKYVSRTKNIILSKLKR